MCWADVRINRSQVLRSTQQNSLAGPTTVNYNAWTNRIRLAISTQGQDASGALSNVYVPMQIAIYAGSSSASPIIYSGDVYGLLNFDYSIYGNLLQGPLTVIMDLGSSGQAWCIAEIELVDPSNAGTPRGTEI